MQDWLIKHVEKLDWPVLTLEMRRFKRSERSFVQMLWVAIALSLIGLFLVFQSYCAYRNLYESADMRVILAVLASVLRFVYVLFVVPAYSSRTIAAEREMQRFENLAMTRLTSWEVIIQKAAPPMLYALAISAALLPLDVLLAWSTGAFSVFSIVGPLYFLLQTAVYTSVGILCSCMCARARAASSITYAVILLAPVVSSMLWAGLIMAFVIGVGRSAAPYTPVNTLQLLTGLGTLATAVGVTLLCFFLASRKLESLRHAA